MKALKKAWIFLLLVCLAALFSTVVLADEPDYDSEGFYTDGETTYYQPIAQNTEGVYEIGNAGQLFWFAALVNGDTTQADVTEAVPGADAVLTADITIPDGYEWVPIGNYGGYSGTFDGQEHTVSGVYIDISDVVDDEYYGFFGYLVQGTVENVVLEDSSISVSADEDTVARACIGGIVGVVNYGSTVSNCKNNGVVNVAASGYFVYAGGIAGQIYGIGQDRSVISDCESSGTVSVTAQFGNAYVGGIIGEMSGKSTISGCKTNANVSASDCSSVGGIAGQMYASIIDVCENNGDISVTSEDNYPHVGGIVGYAYGSSEINDCKSSGSVTASSDSGSCAGGIMGSLQGSVISGCTASGDVSGATAGGIVGNASKDGSTSSKSEVRNCKNSGNVNGTSYAGGIAGIANYGSTVSECENSGNVSAEGSTAGGIAGTVSRSGTVECSINTGNVSLRALGNGRASVGGVVGDMSDSSTVSNCKNSGSVTATALASDGYGYGEAYAGGVAGYILTDDTVSGCYSTGTVSGTAGSSVSAAGVVSTAHGTVVNCCYLSGTASDGIASGDGEATAMTAAQFAGGTAAWLLNDGVTDGTQAWYQTIGEDNYPVLDSTHDTVTAPGESDPVDSGDTESATPGDLNGDGEVNASDLTIL
ncbi:MAG: hypothetical protein LUC21_05285, partial [Oscillospiraceae bacterium]|nr:hypothetical protein [Oscillospiraceae bacterium]